MKAPSTISVKFHAILKIILCSEFTLVFRHREQSSYTYSLRHLGRAAADLCEAAEEITEEAIERKAMEQLVEEAKDIIHGN